jgi:hypothetical protein
MKERKTKQVLSGDWYQWEGEGNKKRVKENECDRNMYSRMKMEQ